MKNTLLIYNLVPELTYYYAVPLDHPNIEIIRGAHGAEINISDPTPEQQNGIDYINDATSINVEHCNNPEHVGQLKQYEIKVESLIDMDFDGVIVCSFYL